MCEQWFLWEPGLRGCAMQGERSLWFGREASHGPFKGSLGAPGRGLPAACSALGVRHCATWPNQRLIVLICKLCFCLSASRHLAEAARVCYQQMAGGVRVWKRV